jgi:hypothetical protein
MSPRAGASGASLANERRTIHDRAITRYRPAGKKSVLPRISSRLETWRLSEDCLSCETEAAGDQPSCVPPVGESGSSRKPCPPLAWCCEKKNSSRSQAAATPQSFGVLDSLTVLAHERGIGLSGHRTSRDMKYINRTTPLRASRSVVSLNFTQVPSSQRALMNTVFAGKNGMVR